MMKILFLILGAILVACSIAAVSQTSATYSTAGLGLHPPANSASFQPLWALCSTTKTVQVTEFRVSGDMTIGSGDIQFLLAVNPNGLAAGGSQSTPYFAWKMDSAEPTPVSTVYVWNTQTPPMLTSLAGWNYLKNQDIELDGKPYSLYKWDTVGKPITLHNGECLHLLLNDVPPNVNYVLLDAEFVEL